MKIKKTLSKVILIITLALVLSALASCSFTHEHAFTDWESVNEPTCTSIGLKKRACICGYVEYGTLPQLSHTPLTDEATDATCITSGKTEGSHCKDCGATIVAQTETDRLAHEFSAWDTVTNPTCTSIGLKKRACECGQVEYETVNAIPHAPVTDEAVPATCTTPGKTEGSHCATCGLIITAQNPVAPIGHSCNDVTVLQEALCNLDGIKRFSCTNSGCSYYYDESYSIPVIDSGEIYAKAIQYTGVIQSFDRYGNFMEQGSAFVISRDGRVITNNDNVDNAFSAIFKLGENEYTVTEVLATDAQKGIAVLQVDATELPSAVLCARDSVNAEVIYTVGTPDGLSNAIMSGVISNADIRINNVRYIQHDAGITAGCSGGPLINRFGEVIGINIGYVGVEFNSVAVSISELDFLDYSAPVSMYEFGNISYTPAEQLDDWVNIFCTTTSNNEIAYVIQGNDFYYSLGYNPQYNYSYVEGYWAIEGNYQLSVRIIFNNSEGTYEYWAVMTDGAIRNEVIGFIDAATFTESTVLTYDTFYGRYWSESELMALYSKAVYDTLGFFSYCLDTYFEDLTLESFGFTSISYERDEEALTKLQNFVKADGAYEPLTGSYVLSGESQNGEDVWSFNISYHLETGDTVVSVHYMLASGETYSVYLTLNTTENGNRFDFMYTLDNGSEYIVQNVAWGYLDANTLTSLSELTCYEFDGMNEYEDGLLADYTSLLGYMMRLLNESVMPLVDPALTVKDLGFLFYFG